VKTGKEASQEDKEEVCLEGGGGGQGEGGEGNYLAAFTDRKTEDSTYKMSHIGSGWTRIRYFVPITLYNLQKNQNTLSCVGYL